MSKSGHRRVVTVLTDFKPIDDLELFTPIRDTDHAWAAGIIDGEGCIALQRSRKTYRLRLWVGSNDGLMSSRLFDIFQLGGLCVTGKQHIWFANGLEAATALVRVKDFLIVKKAEAEIAIQFAETMIHTEHRISEEVRREREDMVKDLALLGNRRRRGEL